MRIPFIGRAVDERFWQHRQKSTSIAGVIGGLTAILLFAYRFYVNHVWSWDLLAVALTFVIVKMAMMAWYVITD
jgi:phage shock protein PspC (stress-responsive transcriptional regulator)